MKIIFLDFDGVIITKRSKYWFDSEKLILLQQIIDQTNSKIVISSSWRCNSVKETIKRIKKSEEIRNNKNISIRFFDYINKDDIIDVTPYIFYNYYNKYGKIITTEAPRGLEIQHYFRRKGRA